MKNTPPVALFGFNRPAETERVMESIRAARPGRLFLCQDAPRTDHREDTVLCQAVRNVFESVDWPCEVLRNYAENNMGCRRRMSSGISWVFSHEEEAILLEDDCVPHADFYQFCAELLERYRFDSRIGMIAGHIAHLSPMRMKDASYYFDRFPTIWGWATWRRAWNHFDAELVEWDRLRGDPFLSAIFPEQCDADRVAGFFEDTFVGRSNSWANIWWFTMIRQNFLCIHPYANLISNIGMQGVHNSGGSPWHGITASSIDFPLKHPYDYFPNMAEECKMRRIYGQTSFWRRVRHRCRLLSGV